MEKQTDTKLHPWARKALALWKRPASRALWWGLTSPLLSLVFILYFLAVQGAFFSCNVLDLFILLLYLTLVVLAVWLFVNRARALDIGWGVFHRWTLLAVAAWGGLGLLCDGLGIETHDLYDVWLLAGAPIGVAVLILETACATLPSRKK